MNAIDPSDPQSYKRPFIDTGPERPGHSPTDAPPRHKRPKTSKACNACRKQKSRCERLAGDTEGCHRCNVIGIPCIFDLETSSPENDKSSKPRRLLPRNQGGPSQHRSESPGSSRLHILANTTELVFRNALSTSPRPPPSHSAQRSPRASVPVTVKPPLSPETISTVESTLFTAPRDQTSDKESSRFRADWERWIAPLTHLQTLVRRNAEVDSNWRQSYHQHHGALLSVAEEVKMKKYFLLNYAPWLPHVRLGPNGNLDDVSPFLSTVVCATAALTFGEITQSTMDGLRGLAMYHLGKALADPTVYPLVESLYAILILIVWPLNAATNVGLLVHGAKTMASSDKNGAMKWMSKDELPKAEDSDYVRLWYSLCAHETISTLGAGQTVTPPDLNPFIRNLGTGPQIELRRGKISDVILALQIQLHDITIGAMNDRPFSLDKTVSGFQNVRETIDTFINSVNAYRTRLIKWEIEFQTIKGECSPQEAVYYAVLEMEFHYFVLMFIMHATLTISYAYPIHSAPEDVRITVWSWCTTMTKSPLAMIRLFNTYTSLEKHSQIHGLPPFAVAPHRIFAMLVLSIMILLRQQVISVEYSRRLGLAELPAGGFTKHSDNAVRKAVGRMGYIGTREGMYHHPAARYFEILEALLRCWDRKASEKATTPPLDGPEGGLRVRNQASTAEVGHDTGGARVDSPTNVPLVQMHQDNADMALADDLNMLGGDLFADATTAFRWEGPRNQNWMTVGQEV